MRVRLLRLREMSVVLRVDAVSASAVPGCAGVSQRLVDADSEKGLPLSLDATQPHPQRDFPGKVEAARKLRMKEEAAAELKKASKRKPKAAAGGGGGEEAEEDAEEGEGEEAEDDDAEEDEEEEEEEEGE